MKHLSEPSTGASSTSRNPSLKRHVNGDSRLASEELVRSKRRVTITLPTPLLERLRNAVYWTGTLPLAQLIAEALETAVSDMEQINGGTFPARLAPLKRGRPRMMRPLQVHSPSAPPAPAGTTS